MFTHFQEQPVTKEKPELPAVKEEREVPEKLEQLEGLGLKVKSAIRVTRDKLDQQVNGEDKERLDQRAKTEKPEVRDPRVILELKEVSELLVQLEGMVATDALDPPELLVKLELPVSSGCADYKC